MLKKKKKCSDWKVAFWRCRLTAVLSQYKTKDQGFESDENALYLHSDQGAVLRAEHYAGWHNTLITPGFMFRWRKSALVWEPSKNKFSVAYFETLDVLQHNKSDCGVSSKEEFRLCLWKEFHKRQVLLWLVILWWSEEGGQIIYESPVCDPTGFLAAPKSESVCLLVPSQPQAGTWGMVESGYDTSDPLVFVQVSPLSPYCQSEECTSVDMSLWNTSEMELQCWSFAMT